jgi:general secretion pathway protein H
MYPTGDKESAASSRSGFTVLELLVVMVVVVVAASSVLVLYRKPSAGAEVKAAALVAASRFRDLRALAVSTGTQRVAQIDVAQRTISYGDGRAPLHINRAIKMSVTAAEAERLSSAQAGLRYFPNGSSTGATIEFHAERQSYEVRINWLTGRVSAGAIE